MDRRQIGAGGTGTGPGNRAGWAENTVPEPSKLSPRSHGPLGVGCQGLPRYRLLKQSWNARTGQNVKEGN